MSPDERRLPSRRSFLGLAAGSVGAVAATGALAGCSDDGSRATATSSGPTSSPTPSAAPVGAAGRHQAGVTTPAPPQPNLSLTVRDLARGTDPAALLRRVGHAVLRLTGGDDPRLLGLPPGDLTVTVGVGPRLVAAVDDTLPGAEPLPRYGRHERLEVLGGDVLVQICASDPLVIAAADSALAAVGGGLWTTRWRQSAYRAQNVPVSATATAPRNLLGFVDGIVGPRTAPEFDRDVWIGDGRAADGTILAVRRMAIDLDRFTALDVGDQERVIGRTRAEARPLTGGGIASDPDLGAKTPSGAYVIPADAHLRRANPASAGVRPMLRRSYSFDGGLLFLSFQDELRTFTTTLARMTTMDALLGYTVTTHAGAFLVLPGFDAGTPLGASLFAA